MASKTGWSYMKSMWIFNHCSYASNFSYRLYYQYTPTRLATCPLTIHALLHIADGIDMCGPVWAYWAFPMERYCALLQRAVLNSRRHPYVTLDHFIAEDAMLSQLKMRYDLYSELSLQPQRTLEGHTVSTCKWIIIFNYFSLKSFRSVMHFIASSFNCLAPFQR